MTGDPLGQQVAVGQERALAEPSDGRPVESRDDRSARELAIEGRLGVFRKKKSVEGIGTLSKRPTATVRTRANVRGGSALPGSNPSARLRKTLSTAASGLDSIRTKIRSRFPSGISGIPNEANLGFRTIAQRALRHDAGYPIGPDPGGGFAVMSRIGVPAGTRPSARQGQHILERPVWPPELDAHLLVRVVGVDAGDLPRVAGGVRLPPRRCCR